MCAVACLFKILYKIIMVICDICILGFSHCFTAINLMVAPGIDFYYFVIFFGGKSFRYSLVACQPENKMVSFHIAVFPF